MDCRSEMEWCSNILNIRLTQDWVYSYVKLLSVSGFLELQNQRDVSPKSYAESVEILKLRMCFISIFSCLTVIHTRPFILSCKNLAQACTVCLIVYWDWSNTETAHASDQSKRFDSSDTEFQEQSFSSGHKWNKLPFCLNKQAIVQKEESIEDDAGSENVLCVQLYEAKFGLEALTLTALTILNIHSQCIVVILHKTSMKDCH